MGQISPSAPGRLRPRQPVTQVQAQQSFGQPTPYGSRPMVPSHDGDLRPHPLSLHNPGRDHLREALTEPDPFSPPPALDSLTCSPTEDTFFTGHAPLASRYPTTVNPEAAQFSERTPGGVLFREEPLFDAYPQTPPGFQTAPDHPRRPSYRERFFSSSAPPNAPLPSPFAATNPGISPVYTAQGILNRARYSTGDLDYHIRPPPGFESAPAVRYYYADEPRICERCHRAEAVYPINPVSQPSWAPTPFPEVGRPRNFDPLASGNANTHINTGMNAGVNTGFNIGMNTGAYGGNINTRGNEAGVNTNMHAANANTTATNNNNNNNNGNNSTTTTSRATNITPPVPTYPTTTSDHPPTYNHPYYGDEGDVEDINDSNLRAKLNRLLVRSAATTLAALYPSFPTPTLEPEDEGEEDEEDDNFQPIPSMMSTPPMPPQQAGEGDIPIIATIPLHSLPPPPPPPLQDTTTGTSPLSSLFDDTDDDDEDDDEWPTLAAGQHAAAGYFASQAMLPAPVSAFDFSDSDSEDSDSDSDDSYLESDSDSESDEDEDEDVSSNDSHSITDSEAEQLDFELELTNFFPAEWDWETLLLELAHF
ncbi:hypothetical protein B0I37DRAFT_423534 [Chaetomium sp. MPI-CAGE-AT-0009]|nr:hypothetical protein B0I37DRAFT_423534 [Chaetomium sp. MPI-CAGE-AT-0009]